MNDNEYVSDSVYGSDSDGSSLINKKLTIGHYGGHAVILGVHRDPEGAAAPDDFGANLFVPNADGKNVDIVRIDTAHNGCHADRFYLPSGHPNRSEDYSLTLFSPEEVLEWLLTDGRWEDFVERYDKNHGLPPSALEEVDVGN